MEPIATNALTAIATTKENATEIYKDLLQPPFQKIGKTLSNFLELSELATGIIPWMNQRSQIFFAKNLKRYKEKLDAIDVADIVTPPSEIAIPLLKRFEYVSNEKLSDLFTNLLTSASTNAKAMTAHPGFISILDRLAPDEAKLLNFMESNPFIPSVSLLQRQPSDSKVYSPTETVKYFRHNYTQLIEQVELDYPQNVPLYLENLISVGLVELDNETTASDLITTYEAVEAKLREEYMTTKPEGYETDVYERRIIIQKGMYHTNHLFTLFMQACSSY